MAMLTPNKIKGYQFQQAGRGTYRAEEVDDFLSQIVESYEQVFKENGELVKKLNILATRLNEYRKEEGNVSKALINAQSFIDRMIEDANTQAKKIVAEAESRAKNVDTITNSKIKVMVDEVEGKMRVAYDKAMAQAKQTKDSAYEESETMLLEARQKADITIDNAKKTAAVIISDATKEAEKQRSELKSEIEKEKEILDNLKATSQQFKTELVVLYERQIKSVEQIPDYTLSAELEETVKDIVEENESASAEPEINEEKVEKIVEEFVSNEDDYFDADDLIREYADKDAEDVQTEPVLDFESLDDKDDEKAEDIFSFDFDEAVKEAQPDEMFSFDFGMKGEENKTEEDSDFSDLFAGENADEYEDVFSDSGSGDSFRFTSADAEEEDDEAPFEFKTEDVNIFSEEAAKEDIAITRPEKKRKFDVAFSKSDEVKIEKDEELFLAPEEEVKEKKDGFSLFDNIDIDVSDDEDFDIEDDEIDADDIFGASDDDDDSEGFSFLKNIFGKKD